VRKFDMEKFSEIFSPEPTFDESVSPVELAVSAGLFDQNLQLFNAASSGF